MTKPADSLGSRIGAFIGAHDILVLVAFYSMLLVQAPLFASDAGVGWHLKTGEWIAKHFSVPYTDPFLFSSQPRAWICDQWLSDLILWVLYQAGNWPLLYAFLAVIFGAVFFVLLYRTLRDFSGFALPVSLALILAFKLAQIHFVLRPVIFGIALFALLYCLTLNILKYFSVATTQHIMREFHFIALGAVLFALWANIHPTFVLGWIFLVSVFLGLALDRYLLEQHEVAWVSPKFWAFAALLLFVAVAATLLNPNFLALHQSIYALGTSAYFMRYHQEWLGVDFISFEGKLVFFVSAALWVALVISPTLRRHLGFRFLVPFLVFLWFGITAQRGLPFFGIVASLPFALALAHLGKAEALQGRSLKSRLVRHFAVIESFERRAPRGAAIFFALSCLVFGDVFLNGQTLFYRGPYGPAQERYPYISLGVLKDLATPENKLAVLAPADWGGFMTLEGEGSLEPIIDDRNVLLGEQFYKDFHFFMNPTRDWLNYAVSLGSTHLLWPAQSDLARKIKQNGDAYLVHEDEIAIVFELRSTLSLNGEDGD
jgi:hypothetical protein